MSEQKKRARMGTYDEANLTWFFSAGAIAFERSTTGSMLERAENFFVDRPYVPFPKIIAGVIVRPDNEVTARPTAETHAASGYQPDDAVMTKAALIGARLRTLQRKSRLAVIVLELVYGDAGSRWEESQGRTFALWPFTEAGRKLIAHSKQSRAKKSAKGKVVADSDLDLSDIERLAALVSLERSKKGQPDPERAEAFERARQEADEMLSDAAAEWNAVKPEQRGRAA